MSIAAVGGFIRTLRDAWKRYNGVEEAQPQGILEKARFFVAQAFDVADSFFDITLGAATGVIGWMLVNQPDIEANTTLVMLLMLGYAGADLLDVVLDKGIQKIKALLEL